MRFCGHGFDVDVAELKAGVRHRREYTDAAGHEWVVTLNWSERLGMPHVATYRKDLTGETDGQE